MSHRHDKIPDRKQYKGGVFILAYSLRTLSLLWQEGRVAGVSMATGIQRDFLTSQCTRETPLVQGLNYNPYDPPSGEPPLPARSLIPYPEDFQRQQHKVGTKC